jgi:protein SCO1/2
MSTDHAEAPSAGTRTRLHWVIATATLAALALSAWFAIALSRAMPPPAFDAGPAASVLRVPRALPGFALTDHEGQRFDEARLEGQWSFLFFGYTYCPDVCPITLGNLRDVRELLASSGDARALDGVQFVFVSVDPERDTPERLGEFVPYFHRNFIGATGNEDELERLTGALGIHRAKAEGGTERDYLIDHSTAVMLIDPQRRLHAVFSRPHDPDAIADAFLKIRRRGGRG